MRHLLQIFSDEGKYLFGMANVIQLCDFVDEGYNAKVLVICPKVRIIDKCKLQNVVAYFLLVIAEKCAALAGCAMFVCVIEIIIDFCSKELIQRIVYGSDGPIKFVLGFIVAVALNAGCNLLDCFLQSSVSAVNFLLLNLLKLIDY